MHGGERGQNDWTRALHGGLDDGIESRRSLRLVMADLADQDERVAHQDSGQRDQPDRRVDAERLFEQEQGRDDPDEAERCGCEHHRHH